ncbi:DNA helicase-2 / ATP-dependent DNA helicase PcrA [Clostridium cavendishii DSM 21758]|uniref:DNA helicase-2 / ATP-dependent DNA helicase PcrA n=1 Tax=Clostridium cavendishii DSM 21758 TaxID=1121302 RepID=A0A1M6ESX4_9CLOT|nr:RNA polymerase recycling motor HelD [Clostridium cavendishii]SHI88528.1 DNA helicase-2 / ATP-dependent DNA helicase PcrA [Clostridium cavendishii DSM 21758]
MNKNEILKLEQENLREMRLWLKEEQIKISKDEEQLKDKIVSLRKASKGSYSEELETSTKLYNIVSKNVENYKEAYDNPYFAKIDFREYRKEKESFYIGKFGLGDMATGDEKVIDWRAPIADLYYSGTQGEAYYRAPIGVIEGELSLKRKFLYKDNDIKECFDEGINEIILKAGIGDEEGNALIDEFLKINLEESTGSKLKEVVATIQKEQNDIIRADKTSPLIVQGSAGSGKTTVALHRLAYLLYRYKDTLTGEDILVVAPNKLFLDYISEVLPNLGVDKVNQKTFEQIVMEKLKLKAKVITKDKKLADILEGKDELETKYLLNESKVKGSLIFKQMMDRYLRILERQDSNVENITVMGYKLFESSEIKRLFTKDLIHFPINKRKDEIKRYFSLKLNEKIYSVIEKVDFQYEYQIARIKKQLEDGPERRAKLIEIYDERDALKKDITINGKKEFEEYFNNWKEINTANLYGNFFENESIFTEANGGMIPEKLANYIKEKVKNNIENDIVDSDDLAAMLYLKFKIEGLSEKEQLKHIVIDEAQDYSLFQLYVVNMLCLGNSLTIVGDLGQGIYSYKGINDWNDVIEGVFNSKATYTALTQSYRSTIEIIRYANKVLEKQKNSLKPAKPVLRHGRDPQSISYETTKEFCEKLDDITAGILAEEKRSIAIIGRTFGECKKIKEATKKYSTYNWKLVKEADKDFKLDLIIIPSYLTKGLEFDCSIIYNGSNEIYSDNELDKKLLYVSLTRALHYEYLFFKGEKSTLLV